MKFSATILLLFISLQSQMFAQNFTQTSKDNSVVMTWNKNTPEQEMKDDIKALKANNGVSIKYSNLKRNSKNEITNLKIEYSDNEGNSGSQEYNNKNAIPEIHFYKNNGEIGFGNPNNNGFNNNMAFGNLDLNDLQKQFSSGIKIDTLGNNKNFTFDFNDGNTLRMNKKSKIIIQKDGRKPLVIENGVVTEGESEYSKEEIEKIKNENKVDSNPNGAQSFGFSFDENDFNNDNLRQQMEQLQRQFQRMMPESDNSLDKKNEDSPRINKPSKKESDDLKKEMKEAKDEMIKAKKEMEEAKKELQKAKSEMKIQKI